MKLHELVIDHFMGIEHATIRLADRGLVVIQGVNKDDTSAESNGAGKSSIADALDWVCYGETARGVSGDDVVNDVAKKGTRVTLTVEDSGVIYTIARHRKHKEKKNTLTLSQYDGFKDIDLTKGTDKLTQDEVTKLLGSSHSVFTASIYAGQDQMPDLPAMTDKNLKVLIEEAAGTAVLEAAYKSAREIALLSTQAAYASEVSIDGLNSVLSHKKEELVVTKEAIKSFAEQTKVQIANLQASVAPLVTSIKDIDKQIAALPPRVDLTSKIYTLEQAISGAADERTELAASDRKVQVIETQLRINANAQVSYSATLERLADDLTHLNEGHTCSACSQPLSDELLESSKLKKSHELDGYQELLSKTILEANDLTQALTEAVEAHAQRGSTLTDVTDATAQRSELQTRLQAVSSLENSRAMQVQQAHSLKERMTALKDAENPHAASQERIKLDIDRRVAEIAAEKIKLDDLKASALIDAEVVKLFSPSGVRAHILDDVTPYLNAQTSQYLTTLSDGNLSATWSTVTYNAKGEGKEKFSIDVSKKIGAKKFGGLSGGEKRKARLATALALQDLVGTRATKPIDLFVADEIDDALDTAGLERLMTLLEEKARERGSVFIISHRDLKDWVSNVLTVTMEGGKATVSESTS